MKMKEPFSPKAANNHNRPPFSTSNNSLLTKGERGREGAGENIAEFSFSCERKRRN